MIKDISGQGLCTGGKAFSITSQLSDSKKNICENSNNSSDIVQDIQVQNAQVDLDYSTEQAPVPPEAVSSQDRGKQGQINRLVINGLHGNGKSHCRTNDGMEFSGRHNQHTSLKEDCLPGKQVNILQTAESAPKQAVPLFENRVSEGVKDSKQPDADKEPSSFPGNNQHTAPRKEYLPVEQISILQDAEGAPKQVVPLVMKGLSEGSRDIKRLSANSELPSLGEDIERPSTNSELPSLPGDKRNISLNKNSLPLEQVNISQVAEGTPEQVVPVPQFSVPFSYLPLFSILSICPLQHSAADDDSMEATTFKAFTALIILMNLTEGVVEVHHTGKYITFSCKQKSLDGDDPDRSGSDPDGHNLVNGHSSSNPYPSISMVGGQEACPFMHGGVCSKGSNCKCHRPILAPIRSLSEQELGGIN